jgi:hypothetical protein
LEEQLYLPIEYHQKEHFCEAGDRFPNFDPTVKIKGSRLEHNAPVSKLWRHKPDGEA